MINELSDYKVPISIREPGMDKSYCGDGLKLKELGIKFDGLEKEIKNCYENFCKRNV